MDGMSFITPLKVWDNIEGFGTQQEEKTDGDGRLSMFGDVFRSVVDQVKETEADVEDKLYLLSTGQLDDVHTLPIAEEKAGFALDVLITLRNKTLEAYNELIKINV